MGYGIWEFCEVLIGESFLWRNAVRTLGSEKGKVVEPGPGPGGKVGDEREGIVRMEMKMAERKGKCIYIYCEFWRGRETNVGVGPSGFFISGSRQRLLVFESTRKCILVYLGHLLLFFFFLKCLV